jgi:hypothetical protein
MSTVKISQLPNLTRLDSNTSNTILIGIDKSTSVTGQFTSQVLADGLYANTPLNVGNNQITFPGTVAQFAGNNESYIQINLQNKNGSGSSDYVVTANNGSDSTYYGDFGIAGSDDNETAYSAILPLDTYLYAQGGSSGDPGGNLVIGTATTGKTIKFIAGGTSNTDYVAQLSTNGLELLKKPLTFADGTTQNTSATITSVSAASFANGAFITANAGYDQANTGASFANGSFKQANSAASFANGAFVNANASFTKANSAGSFANGAFITANSASDVANSAASFANGSFLSANSAASFANGAFDKANSAASFANGAFSAANSAASFANGAFAVANVASTGAAFANGAFDRANTGSTFANGAFSAANSAASFANGAFSAANSAASFANGSFVAANSAASFANGAFIQANSAASFANGAFDKANSAGSFANGAFTSANSGWSKANSAYSLAGTQAGRLDIIEPIAQAAFTNAASALQNTSGTFAGSLAITGDLSLLNGSITSAGNMTVNGTIVLANSNFSATESAVTIKATANVATPSNDGYMLHISGKQNTASRIVFDSYSVTGNAYAVVAGRTARGTVDAPLPVANGDVLMRVSGNGRGDTSWASLGVARMDIVATENYTDAHRGSQIQFWNCAVGSNTLQQIATFNGNSVQFTGQVEPQKGFVYTPRILQGAQTAITIDFTTDSMIRGTFAATVTNSFTNYVAGKVVEMWLTNTAGNGQTVVHGCLANNSTIGATSLSIASGRSVFLKYFSIDGDQANTFVAVTYA